MVNAATIPDKRALEPADKLAKVCVIGTTAHTKKKKPFKILAPLVQYILYFLALGARDFIY
jgi:hypothetical protein